jgi:hypothetical protein
MATSHTGLPKKVPPTVFSKRQVLADLVAVDRDPQAQARILALENGFRTRVQAHVASLPLTNARLVPSAPARSCC